MQNILDDMILYLTAIIAVFFRVFKVLSLFNRDKNLFTFILSTTEAAKEITVDE